MDPHAFLDCAKQYQWEAIEQALNGAPELVNVQPAGRWSALHQAAQADDLRAVEMLLRFRADPLAKTRDGETPRDVAVGGEVRGVLKAAEAAETYRWAEPRTRGSAVASDAFFPFRDGIDAAAEVGVSAVIEPGGSMRDDEVIAAADEHGIAMVFTGMRHFRH